MFLKIKQHVKITIANYIPARYSHSLFQHVDFRLLSIWSLVKHYKVSKCDIVCTRITCQNLTNVIKRFMT